nr:hypothetical protein [Nakamurella multipartita]
MVPVQVGVDHDAHVVRINAGRAQHHLGSFRFRLLHPDPVQVPRPTDVATGVHHDRRRTALDHEHDQRQIDGLTLAALVRDRRLGQTQHPAH